jgi:hypothetical protein
MFKGMIACPHKHGALHPPRRSRSAQSKQNPAGLGLDLQALLAKLLHYGFTQNIGIEFAGFCKFDNSLGDHLIGTIVAVCKSKS